MNRQKDLSGAKYPMMDRCVVANFAERDSMGNFGNRNYDDGLDATPFEANENLITIEITDDLRNKLILNNTTMDDVFKIFDLVKSEVRREKE